MKTIAMIAVSALLAGCISVKEEVAQQDCLRYGLTPGTESYAKCLMLIENRFAVQEQAFYANLGRMGDDILYPPRAIPVARAPGIESITCHPWLNGMRCVNF